MGLIAIVEAEVNSAALDPNQFEEVTFSASFQKAPRGYDTTTGVVTNNNPTVTGQIILPEAALSEIDGESLKQTTLQGIVLRSWIPGLELSADDVVTVNAGVFSGTYKIAGAPEKTVVHFGLNLVT